jgi:hypothetical protein
MRALSLSPVGRRAVPEADAADDDADADAAPARLPRLPTAAPPLARA